MVRKLSKPEVIRRIAMRALLDTVPGMTHARLVALCHASYTTVHDAAMRPVKDWLAVLELAPDQHTSRVSDGHGQPTPRPTIVTVGHRHDHTQHRVRPGDRRRARLIYPDESDQAMLPDNDPDVDIEPSDAGWQDDRDIVVVDPLDDPIPRRRKKSGKKG